MRTKRIIATIVSIALVSPVAAFAHAPEYHTERDTWTTERGSFPYGDEGVGAAHPKPMPAPPPSPTASAPASQ